MLEALGNPHGKTNCNLARSFEQVVGFGRPVKDFKRPAMHIELLKLVPDLSSFPGSRCEEAARGGVQGSKRKLCRSGMHRCTCELNSFDVVHEHEIEHRRSSYSVQAT